MKTIKETPTRIFKSMRGQWTGATTRSEKNRTFEIRTLKTNSGAIITTGNEVDIIDTNCVVVTHYKNSLMMSPFLRINHGKHRATEKNIKGLHFFALVEFDKKINTIEFEEETDKSVIPEIGTIIFLDGYNKYKGHPENNNIVYKIDYTNWGVNYLTVEKNTLKLSQNDRPRLFSEKFGIGNYYEPGYNMQTAFKMDQNDLNNLVIEAKQKQIIDQETKEKAKEAAQALRLQKIEDGKKLINVPTWAKSVIVADLYQDDSDSMTDYFRTSVQKTVYLSYSKTTRNNMNELKKAAENFKETKDFLKLEGQEHTGGHSYLPNYFLGSNRWFGWKVNKSNDYYMDLSNSEYLDVLYIAATEGRFLIPEEQRQEPPKQPIPATKTKIQVIDYSARAFALIGETKPIKEILKKLGGRFNFRLKCGAGWIFPKTRQSEVLTALNLI